MDSNSDELSKPYLSVVVASRNDNHGGDLQLRMQTFINSLAELSDRHSLPLELLIVEWNPPADRPRLKESIQWPESRMCDYRIVEVPPALHEQFSESCAELPLFQMIAKNVGICRAKADFVLATNLDLIFSDELVQWLATRPLEEGKHYRVDRYDVPLEVMHEKGLEAQLEYSKENVLRINSRFGTFDAACFLHDKDGNLIYTDFGIACGLFSGNRLMSSLLSMDYDLPCFVLRAHKHWLSSKSFFWEALRKRSAGSFAKGIVYGIKSAMRIGRTCARIFKLSTMTMIQRLFPFIRFPQLLQRNTSRLHTNACGDFTMLSKQDWMRLRGYAEFDMYSWHLDSLLLHAAGAAQVEQKILPHPIYHIEHTGGWTPESSDLLFSRLTEKGIPFLTNEDLEHYRKIIAEAKQPYCFNEDRWGLSDQSLSDFSVKGRGPVSVRAA